MKREDLKGNLRIKTLRILGYQTHIILGYCYYQSNSIEQEIQSQKRVTSDAMVCNEIN
jgi:hypothetical protein